MIVEGSKAKPRAREAIVVVLAVMLAVIQLSAVPAIATAQSGESFRLL
jgi:hypothetical protein